MLKLCRNKSVVQCTHIYPALSPPQLHEGMHSHIFSARIFGWCKMKIQALCSLQCIGSRAKLSKQLKTPCCPADFQRERYSINGHKGCVIGLQATKEAESEWPTRSQTVCKKRGEGWWRGVQPPPECLNKTKSLFQQPNKEVRTLVFQSTSMLRILGKLGERIKYLSPNMQGRSRKSINLLLLIRCQQTQEDTTLLSFLSARRGWRTERGERSYSGPHLS